MFAGIGGFDLGFERAGFTLAWCIEKDVHAQKVLAKRFPRAKIYGDITQVDETQIERVDVICGGFPCQDVSVAGKRAGLAGDRTGLFFDAIRLVRHINPSLLLLENVPGLLSSNNGHDFATVIREMGEGWDCAEVAWRILDSQYFGVAQRRRRVFIVASSAIGHAEQILALNESVCGDPPTRRAKGKNSATDIEVGVDPCFARRRAHGDYVLDHIGSAMAARDYKDATDLVITESEVSATIAARFGISRNNYEECVVCSPIAVRTANTNANGHGIAEDVTHTLDGAQGQAIAFHPLQDPITSVDLTHALSGVGKNGCASVAVAYRKSRRAQSSTDCETWVDDGLANTLNGFDSGDTRTTHAVCSIQGNLIGRVEGGPQGVSVNEPMYTLTSTDVHAVAVGVDLYNNCTTGDIHVPLRTAGGHGAPAVLVDVIPLDLRNATRDADKLDAQNRQGCGIGKVGDPSPTLSNHHTPGVLVAPITGMVVRRLTPIECERLQGFPDGWTDIGTLSKPSSDGNRYKQLGNAVTVNVAEWLAQRAMKCLQ